MLQCHTTVLRDEPPPDQDLPAEIYTGGPLLTLAVISPTCRGLLLIERSRGVLRAPRVAREVTVIPRLSQRCRTLIWMTMRVYRGPPCINLSRILLVGGGAPSILLPGWAVFTTVDLVGWIPPDPMDGGGAPRILLPPRVQSNQGGYASKENLEDVG